MYIYFTDGSCKGNPGNGGFGVVGIQQPDNEFEIIDETIHNLPFLLFQKECDDTTNNREELKAILYVLINTYVFPTKEKVIIYSDSAYCVNAINDWMFRWANNNWYNSRKKEIENKDLIQLIYYYFNIKNLKSQVRVEKVKGHNNIFGNELADALASYQQNKINNFINQYSNYYEELPSDNHSHTWLSYNYIYTLNL